MQSGENRYLLEVDDLKVHFPIKSGPLRRTVGHIRGVDGISFGIEKGRTFGLVGASGCGKTTVARSIVRLIPVTSGRITFQQRDILHASRTECRELRTQLGLIFQNPFASLNPRMTVGNLIGEPLRVHQRATSSELTERVAALLSMVKLSPKHMNRFPHEFSSGQCQRIAIARALALGPKFVICDEPVGSLDVSIQAQILNLLKELQETSKLTFLFIAHNLAVMEFFCDVVAIMYMGKIVEQAPAEQIWRDPLHPYTRSLIAAMPKLKSPLKQQKATVSREESGAFDPKCGCPFYLSCPFAENNCAKHTPKLRETSAQAGHLVACWRYQKFCF